MTADTAAPTRISARRALTEAGWVDAVDVSVGDDGRIAAIGPSAPGTRPTVDVLLPAMPDTHCHAFQRGIAGLTEATAGDVGNDGNPAPGGGDSFWTWRETMYRAVDALDADRLLTTATALYRDLRARGYGSVAEFHYVHRVGGCAALETSLALLEAADAAGIGLLLLPVLYRRGGFDGRPLSDQQQRFGLSLDDYADLLQALRPRVAARPRTRLGIAPHSLRAVSPEDLATVLALRGAVLPGCPVHIHISEQRAEVDDAVETLGTTPIAWLCDHAPVDRRWVLVHATHATPAELATARARDAVICICTTTEANLGDGVFGIDHWWQLGGALAIGSDSNVGLDPAEELRWLEYQARLHRQRRTVLLEPGLRHPGTSLWQRAVAGGRQGLGEDRPGLAVGAPADLIGLAVSEPSMTADQAVDDFVFAGRAVRLVTGEALAPR